MMNPRIHLAIDNCFASKRWTRPADWASIVKEWGIRYVEASADNECDPLYADPEYLKDWLRDVHSACEQCGVSVANLYSGHGTYATLGLASPDRRNQKRLHQQWLEVMIHNAARLRSGLGFYCHAFNQDILQDPAAYAVAEDGLYGRLAELAAYAGALDLKFIGVEQMYSPHQIPWTLHGSRKFLKEIWTRSRWPLYLTLDTGHQYGQRKFIRLTLDQLRQSLQKARLTGRLASGLWLGPGSAYSLFRSAIAAPENTEDEYLQRLEREMDRYPYLFAAWEDGDTYGWLRELGCYSPVIHLQQTDGTSSSHRPFTEDDNRKGIIHGGEVLHAIAAAYSMEPAEGMPPRCEDIYLTLEMFSGTADFPVDILAGMAESVEYWRRYVPKDGLTLHELLDNHPGGQPPRRSAHPPS
jgi:sugar phosphate isomerase/epimerase